MKIIKQPSYLNSRISHRITLTNAVLSILTLTLIILTLLIPKAHAEEPYRFDRLWPNLLQPWYFVFPDDIAIGPDGLVYVADSDFHRIQVFSTEGEFIRNWGGEGVGNGEFASPGGIAISASGEVYVADTENNRIQVFDLNGVFKRKWGAFGSGNREFIGPGALGVSSSGEVYVVDSFNDRIQVFDTNGVFKRKWGTFGTGDGQLAFPDGIAISVSGEVYIADSENNRIQVFDDNGVFKRKWGSQGSGDGELSVPQGIAVSESGEVYVADSENNRIQVFDTNGVFKRKWGSQGPGDGEFNLPQGIAVSDSGEVYLVEMFNQRVQIFDANGVFKRKWGSQGSGNGEFNLPQEIAISASSEVYVADAKNNRIQVFDSFGVFKRQWGSEGEGDGEFSFPGGIAVSDSDEVYVADRTNHRIQVFDTNGVFKRQWGSKGDGDGEFSFPKSIAISASGEVYVADRTNHRIQVFDANGVFKRKWGGRGAMDGEFEFPKSIAVSASDEVYVADTFNNRIQVFDTSGVFKRKWGSEGFGDGEFSDPQGIVVSASGEVYVTDSFRNPRIQIFDAAGQFIDSISSRGSSPGQIHFPSGVEFDSEGTLYVVDTGNNRIQKFVRSQATTMQHPYKAVILAGGGPPTENYRNLIWNETQLLTNKAHQALRSQGFQKDEVKFLTAGNTQSDLDGNGVFDDFEPATLDSLQQAITQWAVDANDVVIYLADHGGPGRFQINDLEILDANQLTLWVQELDDQIPGKVTLIIEACKSESFLTPLAADQRYLIASADADQAAIISNKGLNAFSYFFWNEISSGADLQGAFKIGRQGMSSQLIEGRPQNAQLDSNGDQQFSSADFTALADFCLGNCTKYAANPPSISEVIAPATLDGVTEATLSMQVNSLEPIIKAWVVITRPDFRHTDSDEPVSELPQIVLQCNDSQLCSTNSNEFDLKGDYQITFYVLDNKNQLAIPETTTLTQTQGILVTNECTLDADGDGRFDAFTDGLLSIRYLFGIRGDSLIKDALASDCANCLAAEVEPILEQCGTEGTSDIDGNGQVDALSDGLLTIRYLLGLRGEPLIKDAVANDCSRCSIAEIEDYLQQQLIF